MENSVKKQRSGIIAAIICNTIFGFSFMFSRIALGTVSAEVLLMLRFIVAFLLINVIVFTFCRRDSVPKWMSFRMKGKSPLPLIGLSFVQPIIYFICEANGIRLTSASVSGVIIATIPIFAIGFGFIFLKEKIRLVQLLFALVSITGVIILTTGQSDSGVIEPLGVLYLMGAVISSALYNTISRKVSQNYSAMECTYFMMGTGAVVFTIMALVKGADLSAVFRWNVMLPVLYLAVMSSILAFLMLNYAVSCLPLAKATSFANLTTVFSLFAGVVFLNEPFNLMSLISCLLIFAGIIGVQKTGK